MGARLSNQWRISNAGRTSFALVLWLLCFAAAGAQAPHPTFVVATVKSAPGADPNTGSWSVPGIGAFNATHVSLALLLQLAYGIDNSQLASKPDWMERNLYDVQAKAEEGIALSRDELKPRLQDLLRQRFHLVVHIEMRPIRGYALVVAKGGPHLLPTRADHFAGYRINVAPGQMRGQNWSMPILAKYLTSVAGFPVIDQTAIAGSYDIGFSYATDQQLEATGNDLLSLGEALKQATGLGLRPQLVPVETVVIDSVDKTPAEN